MVLNVMQSEEKPEKCISNFSVSQSDLQMLIRNKLCLKHAEVYWESAQLLDHPNMNVVTFHWDKTVICNDLIGQNIFVK